LIIIGSKSLYTRFGSEFSERIQKSDFDVIMHYKDFNNWIKKFSDNIIDMTPRSHNKYNIKILINNKKTQFEIELGFENTSSLFLLENKDIVTDSIYIDPNGTQWNTLSLPYLMLMKKSHLYFPIHFEKNINDYHFIKSKLLDFNLDEKMKKFFELRKVEAEKRFEKNHRTPNLNVSNEQFFAVSGKAAGRVYIHDDLHKVVKHFDKPIYDMLKYEDKKNLAWCEKDLFNKLPLDYRIKCVQEEAYVIALERYIIPQIGKYEDFFWCYKRALMRICTTLCSGFFRQFAFENYPLIIESYNSSFVDKFKYAVDNELIQSMEL
jgi:hypothetical protein